MTHLTPEAVAGYIDGALPSEEQRQAELHLATCAECREDVSEIRRLQLGRRSKWSVLLLPVAAAAAVLLVIGLPRQTTTPSDIRAGSETEQRIGIVAPAASAEISPGKIDFIWRSAGAGASYIITLQEADGRVVWTSTIADTLATLPDSVALPAGRTWFWFVDAMLPDGKSLTTGVQRLRTRP
jgi:hypothetical protein